MIDKMSLGLQIAEVFKMMGRQIGKAFHEEGLDIPMEQFIVLNILNSKDDLIQQDIAIIMNKDKSGILRIIDGLEKKKLIVRVTDTADRRKKILVVTKKGADTMQKALQLEGNVAEKFLNGLSEAQLSALGDSLSIIKGNLQK